MEALRIVAGSWPIAIMVVGLAAAIVFRRSFKQVVDNKARQNEWYANTSRVVTTRGSDSENG